MSTHYFRFSRDPVNRLRSPLLERLVARAEPPTAVADWRVDAYRLLAPQAIPMPGIGAVILFADRGRVDAATAFVATPVHYVAEMSNVRLPADGILSLAQSEADALAVDFNRVWQDAGIRLLAGRRADLFCVVDQALSVTTQDPEHMLDRPIETHLPAGAAAPRLRRLMSEIEMWLFEHAVNRTRAAAVINGLWLWGGGPVLTSLPPIDGWTAGDDPYFNAFAVRPGLEMRLGVGSGVVAIAAQPGTDAWHDMESRWLERSLADLKSGRIARLELSAGNRCFRIGARGNWRLWRRRRPWWESFE